MPCNVCSAPVSSLWRAKVLGKYDVEYFRCGRCGFIQTEAPYWLSESYADAITATDLGLVGRNYYYSVVTRAILTCLFNADGRFVDYGGGYGIFVRLMRDAGFDFYWMDRYCENLFARGFRAEAGGGEYELLTAWEVFEHMLDPLREVAEMAALSDNILFSTELIPAGEAELKSWWYFCTEHGQHISFYSAETLSFIAGRFGMRVVSLGPSLHLFSRRSISGPLFRFIAHPRIAPLINLLRRRPTLLESDYQAAKKNIGA